MKNINSKTFLVLVVVLTFLIGAITFARDALTRRHFSESRLLPEILKPTQMSEQLESLTSKNIGNLREISVLAQAGNSPIVALAEAEKARTVLAIDSDGAFYEWSTQAQLLTQHSFFVGRKAGALASTAPPIYRINAGIAFSRDGLFVITPSEVLQEKIYGLNVWSTRNGKRMDCMGEEEYCPDWGTSDDSFTSLSIHPTKDFYVTSFKGSLSGWYGFASNEQEGGSTSLKSGGVKDTPVARLAVDRSGDYLAIADDNGSIQIGDISDYTKSSSPEMVQGFSFEANYGMLKNLLGEHVETIDLEFDDTHSWLAWLTDEELIVWNMRNYILPLHFKEDMSKGNGIAFDRTGRLLAIATQNGIKVFDVEVGQEIANYLVGDVTAIYFSADNRSMIWGDRNGDIHLWGTTG